MPLLMTWHATPMSPMTSQPERKYPDMWVDPEDDPREVDSIVHEARRPCWPSTSTATARRSR